MQQAGPPRDLNLVDAVAQLSFLVTARIEHRAAENDLSMIQTRLLGVLRDRTPTMGQLADLLTLDKSSITGLVDRAEGRGLVERIRSGTDRRTVQVRLTRTGRTLIAKAARGFGSDVDRLLAALTAAQRSVLLELASEVVYAHAAEHGFDLLPSDPSVQKAGARAMMGSART